MAQTIVTLRVTLDFDPEDVEQSEDFDPATQTAESYVRDALAGFLTNEINNCNEYPAEAYAEVVPTPACPRPNTLGLALAAYNAGTGLCPDCSNAGDHAPGCRYS